MHPTRSSDGRSLGETLVGEKDEPENENITFFYYISDRGIRKTL